MRIFSIYLFTLVPVLGLGSVGCAENPADTRPAAKTQALNSKSAVNSSAKNAAPMSLGGDIIFVGSKVTGNHACKFTDWQGAAIPNGDNLENLTLSFTVNMQGILADYQSPNAWSKKLEGHLKSDDFFGVEKHPTSTFVSSRIVASGKGASAYEVTGLMTIKGVQKLISFPVSMENRKGQFKLNAEFSINRKDFNIAYAGKPDDLIRDDVLLKLSFNN
jgi:polyisoprenoid-binding protein YceI